jgi:hypothetical protein
VAELKVARSLSVDERGPTAALRGSRRRRAARAERSAGRCNQCREGQRDLQGGATKQYIINIVIADVTPPFPPGQGRSLAASSAPVEPPLRAGAAGPVRRGSEPRRSGHCRSGHRSSGHRSSGHRRSPEQRGNRPRRASHGACRGRRGLRSDPRSPAPADEASLMQTPANPLMAAAPRPDQPTVGQDAPHTAPAGETTLVRGPLARMRTRAFRPRRRSKPLARSGGVRDEAGRVCGDGASVCSSSHPPSPTPSRAWPGPGLPQSRPFPADSKKRSS